MQRYVNHISIALCALFVFGYMKYLKYMGLGGVIREDLFWAVIIGSIAGVVIGLISEWYAGYRW